MVVRNYQLKLQSWEQINIQSIRNLSSSIFGGKKFIAIYIFSDKFIETVYFEIIQSTLAFNSFMTKVAIT